MERVRKLSNSAAVYMHIYTYIHYFGNTFFALLHAKPQIMSKPYRKVSQHALN